MEQEPRTRVLVVDDDPEIADGLGRKLTYVGYAVEVATDPAVIIERLRNERADWDVVLLDVGLPGISGIDVLKQFRDSGSQAAVIMLTGDASATTATTCLRAGAFHYLTKPCLPIELASTVESAARHAILRRRLARDEEPRPAPLLVGESSAMRRLQAAVDRLASHDVAVLIQGESGTGKELVARALHVGSARTRAFLAINCSAIPDTLIDSELFGHARGAFTGATTDRDGVFVEADGGSLFLDEIGEMPLSLQAKLLHVLESGTVRPLGATKERAVDVRIIVATHRNLVRATQDGSFRKDLLYRLDVVSIVVPALRDHREDIPELLEHFLEEARGRYPHTVVRVFSAEASSQLRRYAWPGNVRELAHTVEKVALLARSAQVTLADLPDPVNGTPVAEPFDFHGEIRPLRELERQYAAWALTQTGGHRGRAAEKLGVDPKTLRKWLDGPEREEPE